MRSIFRTVEEMGQAITHARGNMNVDWLIYQPGNGTRFELVFTKHPVNDEVLLTWVNYGSMVIPNNTTLRLGYLQEKMRIHNDSDACVLLEIIEHMTGRAIFIAPELRWVD